MAILAINVDEKTKNNTNLRNPKYKSNLNNDDNNNIDKSENNNSNKKSVLILGYSTIKSLDDFLISEAMNHKCIVKAQPFSSAKVQCMYDHVNPT